jgi:flagellar biosynthesis protein FliP
MNTKTTKITAFLSVSLLTFLLAGVANAQQITVDLGDEGQLTSRVIQLVALMTILSLAPSILVMVTSFTRIIVVLSLIRSAIGVQQTPPNTVLVSLALFLTFFVMSPVLTESYEKGIEPLLNEEITEIEAFKRSAEPIHGFMMTHVREKELDVFLNLSRETPPETPEAMPFKVLIPAFIVSELRRAFEIGFLMFIPFLIIDMVVASVLMSMGMMMLPPIMIALPFKIIFFVLVDGWSLIATSLVRSFG